jgi:polyphosphate kinase
VSVSRARSRAKFESGVPEPPAEVPQGPARFYNRELSWLQFNSRVMGEARNGRHPVLERLRFLSISASNLDEFFMVRVAGLHGQVKAKVANLSNDGLTPAQQLDAINKFVSGLSAAQQACWSDLSRDMADAGLAIVSPDQLTESEQAWLETYFMTHLFPVLTPIAVDPAHPFPFIPTGASPSASNSPRRRAARPCTRSCPSLRRSIASCACPHAKKRAGLRFGSCASRR